MIHALEAGCTLRPFEDTDVDALYRAKNDAPASRLLVGFRNGMSRRDVHDWLEHHRRSTTGVLWCIDLDGICVGHVGLYQIDHRVRQAEFGILIGAAEARGRGLGRACTRFALDYGFDQLNLNRIFLGVLTDNEIARSLYRKLGFREEGIQRQAQFKDGEYLDVAMMSILAAEHQST